MIDLQNVSYSYDNYLALDSLNCTIKKGEKIVLLGNNGSGKSTLLKLLAGLIYTTSGEYLFNKDMITKKFLKSNNKNFRKDVSILFQDPEIMLFNETVKEEIAFGINELDLDIDLNTIAKKFEITHLLDRNPLHLSGGEKQKVAFAAIFVNNPSLLLLDEPTANLDPKSTGWLIDFLLDLENTTIISTHNLSLAYELGQRAIVLDQTHKIIYDGEIEKLFQNEEILLKANLIHKHKHKHKDMFHSHFHIHNWD